MRTAALCIDVHKGACFWCALIGFSRFTRTCIQRVAVSVAIQLRFTVRLLQTVAKGPWPRVWTWKQGMQREERRHVAAEVWMAAGGRGHWIKSPIRVTEGCGKKGGYCWRQTASPLYLLWPQGCRRPGEGTCQTPQAGRTASASLSPLCPPLRLRPDICLFVAGLHWRRRRCSFLSHTVWAGDAPNHPSKCCASVTRLRSGHLQFILINFIYEHT